MFRRRQKGTRLLQRWIACLLGATINLGHLVSSSSPLSSGPWGPTDPIADHAATIIVPGEGSEKLRVSVLTARVLRIERSSLKNNSFEDRKTVAIINRKLPVPSFQHSRSGDGKLLTVQTKCLTLTYQIGAAFSAETLQVKGQMYCDTTTRHDLGSSSSSSDESTSSWTYHYGQVDPDNLLGTIRTLDQENSASLNCSLRDPITDHCEWGLVSRSGFAIVNDTLNYALSDDDDWWDGPNHDQEDWYIFGHGHDYSAALSDYRLLGGAIPLLPRYSMGVWFTRWYDYTAASAADLIQQFEWHALPLDVFVLDMNWHTKDDWTGYSFDKRLFGQHPEDALSYMNARGVAVSMNLHDANGVNPWEDKYEDMCQAVGCRKGEPVPFSVVNHTIAYALEDKVLQPLENESGVSFWWIDWQQGENAAGAAGAKQNPTIWTAHLRSTDSNRRRKPDQETVKRNMVLARWGGLGSHRYPVHFSGDVRSLSWSNLAYQPYFSMTATNVGAIWSHDIEGPTQDLELYTRWLQWGAISGIMRSHERGMSAGGCAAKDPDACSVVVPWNVAPKFARANMEALRLRGSMVPYLYTAVYNAHKTGQWFTTPMYYKWPELDGAYETAGPRPDANAKYEAQYMLGDDIWAAPVVKPANTTDGLTRLRLWPPPGTWVGLLNGQILRGDEDGTSSAGVYYADLNDIPLFARAGSIIPSVPVRPGATIGLAMKPYDELIWTVYLASGAPSSGMGVCYEDDGESTAYNERDSFTRTTATYNISTSDRLVVRSIVDDEETTRKLVRTSGDTTDQADNTNILETTSTLNFTISTNGHCEKLPTSRATTIRLVNTHPPSSVDVNGQSILYARFGGKGTWSFSSQDAAVVIEIPPSKVSEGLQVTIVTTRQGLAEKQVPLEGLGFRLQRAIAAKAALDEVRVTPGSTTGSDSSKSPGYLLLSASSGSSLEYLAGLPAHVEFDSLRASYQSYLRGAISEVQEIKVGSNDHVLLSRIARAQVLLRTAVE